MTVTLDVLRLSALCGVRRVEVLCAYVVFVYRPKREHV